MRSQRVVAGQALAGAHHEDGPPPPLVLDADDAAADHLAPDHHHPSGRVHGHLGIHRRAAAS